MSGGSLDYFYSKLEWLIPTIKATTPLRRAFKEHLAKVAKALHDIEWVDSDDYGPGDEDKAIRECLSEGAELEQLVKEAKELVVLLQVAHFSAEKRRKK